VRIIGEGKGENNGQFNGPDFSIIKKEYDEIFVSDTGNHRIQVLNLHDGKFIRTIGKGKGKGKGELLYPTGITILGNRLFVCEGLDPWGSGDGNNRISVFNYQTGDYLTSFGSTGSGQLQFNNPFGITSDDNGRLYIVDRNNHRIQIYNEEGVYISQLGGKKGSGIGELKQPISIIIRDNSELFISEFSNNRISIWDMKSGNYLRSFGEKGSDPGQFDGPYGMTVTSQNELIICDYRNHRLQTFE